MSYSSRSPQLVRSGIVLLNPDTGKVLRVITLQYNPDSLTRSLQIKGVGGESSDHSEAMRLKGPPIETIKVEAEIDATDALEKGDSSAANFGLHSQLALLETLIYPTSASLRANNSEARAGSIEIAPMESPLVLFVWSKARVLPVRITELSITEESFDAALNPIRAKVNLGFRVLTVDDVGFEVKSGSLFMSYLEQKEQLAARLGNGALGSLGITGIP
jgi:Contractile injection system tube protein